MIKYIWKSISDINSNYLPAVNYYKNFLAVLNDIVEMRSVDLIAKKDYFQFNNQNFYSVLFNSDNLILKIHGNAKNLGEIAFLSENTKSFLGYNKKELFKAQLSQFLPEPIASKHNSYLKAYFESGYSTRVDKITPGVMLKSNNDPFWVNIFVKNYPQICEDVYYVGIISKQEDKNSMVIISPEFYIAYMNSSIFNNHQFDLNVFKKFNLKIPFYLICPNILKHFKILKGKIYNNSNIESDLNQIVLSVYSIPFVEALMKELIHSQSHQNNEDDSKHDEEIENDQDYFEELKNERNEKKNRTMKKSNTFEIKLLENKLKVSYKSILKKLNNFYDQGETENVLETLKTLYHLKLPNQENIITYIKVKINFSNFGYNVNSNMIICDLKIIEQGILNSIDEIFNEQTDLEELMYQGN